VKFINYLKSNLFLPISKRLLDGSKISLPFFVLNSKIGRNVEIHSIVRLLNSDIGDYVRLGTLCELIGSSVGEYTTINRNCYIYNSSIGKYTTISWNVTIGAWIHTLDHFSCRFCNKPGRVIVGNDVWLGANSVVLPGLTVGDGAVIGAGAVVTKDVPDYAVAVGVPAKIIRFRFDEETINDLKSLKWWRVPAATFLQHEELFNSYPTADNKQRLKKLVEDSLSS
jgi:acetyltransferase-like isoleucine patch superfamily enzyme